MAGSNREESKALTKYALAEIEDRKKYNLKVVRLMVSRHTYSKDSIKSLRDELEESGYRTRIQRGSGNVIVEWD